MFCTKCGTKNPDGAAFCSACGSPIKVPAASPAPAPVEVPAPTPVAEAPAAELTEATESTAAPKSSSKKGLIIGLSIGGGVLLMMLCCILIVVLAVTNSYQHVAKKAAAAIYTNDTNAMLKYDAIDQIEWIEDDLEDYCYDYDLEMEDFYAFFEDRYDASIRNTKDLMKAFDVSRHDYMEDTYGEYTVKTSFSYAEEMSDYELDEYIEDSWACDTEDYWSVDSFSKAYRVYVDVTINGEYDYSYETAELVLVKCGLTWKVLGQDNGFFTARYIEPMGRSIAFNMDY